jgi:hypothetical protein
MGLISLEPQALKYKDSPNKIETIKKGVDVYAENKFEQ